MYWRYFLLLPTYRQVTTKMKDKNQHFPSHVGAHGIIIDLVVVFIVVFSATSGGLHIELSFLPWLGLSCHCKIKPVDNENRSELNEEK
jgi:hypothetical protein